MTRKITLAVVAVALTLAAGSNAFAKGGHRVSAHATHPGRRPNLHPLRHPSGLVRHSRGGRFDRRFAYRGWGYGFASYPVAVSYFGAPIVSTPVLETPVVEAPVIDAAPVVEAPVVDTPAVADAPVVETPAPGEDAPVVEAPVIETPEDDTPAVETSAADAPVVEDAQANVVDDSAGHRSHRRHTNRGPIGGRRTGKTQGGKFQGAKAQK